MYTDFQNFNLACKRSKAYQQHAGDFRRAKEWSVVWTRLTS